MNIVNFLKRNQGVPLDPPKNHTACADVEGVLSFAFKVTSVQFPGCFPTFCKITHNLNNVTFNISCRLQSTILLGNTKDKKAFWD